MSTATYRTLLATPGAAGFFFTAAGGRIGIAMTSLGMVWLIHAVTGSYASAGLATAALALAEASIGPQLGRLFDRCGQTWALAVIAALHMAAVVHLVLVAQREPPVWVLALAAFGVGASMPQLGALSATRWAGLLTGERKGLLPTAFALESLSNGSAYLIGPVAVSTVAATGNPAVGSLLAGGVLGVGSIALAAQRRTAPWPRRRTAPSPSGLVQPDLDPPGRSLLGRAFLAVVCANVAMGTYFASIQVSVAAFTVGLGVPGSAAALFAVSSLSGLAAGWFYGLRRWRWSPRRQLLLVATYLTLACAPMVLADSVLALGLALAMAGLAVPPILVLCAVVTEANVSSRVLTQAFAWTASASAAGYAAAATVAGAALDAHGAPGGFTVAVLAAATVLASAVFGLRGGSGEVVRTLPRTRRWRVRSTDRARRIRRR